MNIFCNAGLAAALLFGTTVAQATDLSIVDSTNSLGLPSSAVLLTEKDSDSTRGQHQRWYNNAVNAYNACRDANGRAGPCWDQEDAMEAAEDALNYAIGVDNRRNTNWSAWNVRRSY